MSDIVTEKNYPIRSRWIIKSSISSFLVSLLLAACIVLSIFNIFSQGSGIPTFYFIIYIPIFLIILILRIVITILQREAFHYEIGDKFLTIQQGIISKQQRQLPYSVIQNLFIRQSLLDRMLNLTLLNIQNAQKATGAATNRPAFDAIGSVGNAIYIPGLEPSDVEALKNLILQKMKENPVESTSGL